MPIIKNTFILFITILIVGCGQRPQSYDPFEIAPNHITINPPIKTETMYQATMRPYMIGNIKYYPTVVNVGDKFRGVASWYGDKFHGRRTSNSEIYNMYDLTAAHKTLPMNTIVKVTNLKNGKSVIVRINDRGPFVKSRIIDLSYKAASQIDMIRDGTAKVELEVLSFDKTAHKFANKHPKSITLENFSVQIGSFSKKRGAQIYKQRYALVDNRYQAYIKRYNYDDKILYKVMLKGFKSELEARDFISKGLFKGSFIIRE